jgi:hypothetical protein
LPVRASASRASSTKSAIFVFCGESGTLASSRFVPVEPDDREVVAEYAALPAVQQ